MPITPTFEGTVSGGLDAITVRLWNLDLSRSRAPGLQIPGLSVFVWLTIDGVASLDRHEIILEPVAGEQSWRRFEFTVADLGFTADGTDVEHHVELRLSAGSRTEASLWGFGASDLPSGVDLNPRRPADHTVPASQRP